MGFRIDNQKRGCNFLFGRELFTVGPSELTLEREQRELDQIETWLVGPVMTAKEVEEKNTLIDRRLGPEPVVFGFLNEKWESLKAEIQDGDTFREFESPPVTWEIMAGRKGVALIRNGKPVKSIRTSMS